MISATIIVVLTVITIFCVGFLAGYCAHKHDNEQEWEDTELLDAMERHQIDVDVFHNRGTEYPDWKVYHPRDAAGYESDTFPTAREAIRHFIDSNQL